MKGLGKGLARLVPLVHEHARHPRVELAEPLLHGLDAVPRLPRRQAPGSIQALLHMADDLCLPWEEWGRGMQHRVPAHIPATECLPVEVLHLCTLLARAALTKPPVCHSAWICKRGT